MMKEKPCKACNGTAKVRVHVGNGAVADAKCPRCDGTGRHRKLTTEEHRARKPMRYTPPPQPRAADTTSGAIGNGSAT